MALNESVIGVKNSDPCSVSPAVQALLDCLTKLDEFVKATPAVTQEVRYGNPAFRDWYDKMKDAAPELVYNIVGDDLGEATIEILPYLLDSFGNRTRIDYGTGHETAFVCFLYCLFCLGVLKEDDCKATVIKVFHAYLALMRDIQTTYWLEPAGSHGVWGLDEYHFFPFLWGAAQLRGHDLVRPGSVSNDEVLEVYAHDYLYLDAVQFVRKVKKGPLHETSPLLYDITAVPNWVKVNQGLFKMYQVEVLSKLPIMQHSLWGSLMPFPG